MDINKERKKTPLYAKLLLSIFSLIFFLSILEVSLWAVARNFYEPDDVYRTDEADEGFAQGVQTVENIIAIGDSFTHGGLVEGNETYTSFLRERFKMSNAGNIRIYNKGICELNTQELLKRLPKVILEYKPKAILLLVGATNRFNPWDYEAYANRNIVSSFMSWLTDLRVAKMARFIKLNLFADAGTHKSQHKRIILMNNLSSYRSVTSGHDLHLEYIEMQEEIKQPDPLNPISQSWYYANAGNYDKATHDLEQAIIGQTVKPVEVVFALAHFHFKSNELKETENLLAEALAQFPDSPRVQQSIVYYHYMFANWYRKKLQYDTAIDYYLKAIALEPDVDYFYYEMNKLYKLQSNLDSKELHRKLKGLTDINPLVSMSKMYNNHLKLYENKQAWEAGIEQWIYDDLKKIVDMCQKNNIKVIVQNYPTDYVMANRVLEKVAKEHELPYVDHQTAFKSLQPKDKYFFDDDHCTKLGHDVMAGNIYKILIDQEIINL